MHDILEGALQLEIKCLLYTLIKEKKIFSLQLLNYRIQSYPYGDDVTDSPKPVPSGALTMSTTGPKKQGGIYNVIIN